MKSLSKASLVLLVIAVLFIIYLLQCNRDPGLGDDEMIISKAVWSEVQALADKPPEIRIDTFVGQGETVYVDRPVPVPTVDPQDTTILVYSDTLSNDSINAWVDFKLRGELVSLRWGYTPMITTIKKETKIYVPDIIEMDVPISKSGVYFYLSVGGNQNTFAYGPGLNLITKKDNLYGYAFQRWGDQNFHMVNIGTRLEFFNRRR